MHEDEKIDEARYFCGQMLQEQNNPKQFRFNLSAFLSAARSVLQYALKEVESTPNQRWYDACMSGSQVLAFFKDLRDVNVHVEPVKVLTNINLEITERLHIVDSLRIEMSDAAGNLIYDPPVETEASQGPTAPNSSSKIYIRYKFIDWPGPEDVLTICQTYLDELERFVADGQSKGILTK